jgi:hypothetical protein
VAESGQQAGGVVTAAREIRGMGEILNGVRVSSRRQSGPFPAFHSSGVPERFTIAFHPFLLHLARTLVRLA